ncbi:hypothetical protein Tco_1505074 [Tanacetum coccineum]
MFVIEQPLPAALAADSAANVLVEWNAIYDAYNEVAYIILGSMTLELHRQFENSSPYDMIKELKDMFEKQARVKSMHNMGKTMGELHAMLIEYEKGLPKKAETPQVMMIKGGKIQKVSKKSLKVKGKGKANDKGNDKQVYIPKPKNPKPSAKENPAKDDAYHQCKEGFREARKLKQGALYLYIGNGVRAQLEAIGSFDLVLPNVLVICLDNCHYALSMTYRVLFQFNQLSLRHAFSIWFQPRRLISTPYEHGMGKFTKLSYLKCLVWETMDCYFYFPPENKIVVARYVEFFEKNLITQEVSGRDIDLEEIQDEDTSPSKITSEIPMEVEGFEPPQEEDIPICRSERTHRAPNRLSLNVEAEEHCEL